jgi:hypothetical protein
LIAASSSRDQRQIPLKDGPQTLAIGNWYKNTKIQKKKKNSYKK